MSEKRRADPVDGELGGCVFGRQSGVAPAPMDTWRKSPAMPHQEARFRGRLRYYYGYGGSGKKHRIRTLGAMCVQIAFVLALVFCSSPSQAANAPESTKASFEAAFQGSCNEKNPCEQTCFDLHDGTFECGCHQGFLLAQDGYSCKVIRNATKTWDRIGTEQSSEHHQTNAINKDYEDDEDLNEEEEEEDGQVIRVFEEVVDGRRQKPLVSYSRTREHLVIADPTIDSVQHRRSEAGEEEDQVWEDNFDFEGRVKSRKKDANDDTDDDHAQEKVQEEAGVDNQEYEEPSDSFNDNFHYDSSQQPSPFRQSVLADPVDSQRGEDEVSTVLGPSEATEQEPTVSTSMTPQSLDALCVRLGCEGGARCRLDLDGQPRCLCPFSRGGDHCELEIEGKFPKYFGSSYLAFHSLRGAHRHIQLTLEFRADTPRGLLLYSGEQVLGGGDFFSLAIIDNHVEFRFDCGSGVGVIRSPNAVRLHTWNKVTLFRHRWDAWMQLNDLEHVQGRSEGLFSRITLKDKLYLGGVGNFTMLDPRVGARQGLVGCVRYLEINGHAYDFRPSPKGDAVDGIGIGECSAEVCNNVECNNGGKCIANSADSALCLCPLGFVGDYCEIVVDLVMPSFNGTSFLKYPGLGNSALSFLELHFTFKPVEADGVFFYNGYRLDGTGDFVALLLSHGFVELRFDLGTGPAIIRSQEPVALNEWHTVFISRTGRSGVLEVNRQPKVEGMSPGAFTQLSLAQNLYVGGLPSFDSVSSQLGVKTSFRGCIQKVVINNKSVKLFEAALVGVNVDNCNHPCVHRPCQNHGLCSPRRDYFSCHCRLGYADSRCQTEVRDNITSPMFVGNSFLRYTEPEIMKRVAGDKIDVSLRFKTLTPDGLLLWSGRRETSPSSDFVALGLDGGFVHLRFNLGSGEVIIRDNSSRVDDGRWHHIRAVRMEQEGSLAVDQGPVSMSMSPGSFTQLNTDNGLFLGGMTDILHLSFGKYSSGFVGCISQLTLATDFHLRLVSQADSGLNIEACV